jgi:hypothetical protein
LPINKNGTMRRAPVMMRVCTRACVRVRAVLVCASAVI